jgi:hypothetical protein
MAKYTSVEYSFVKIESELNFNGLISMFVDLMFRFSDPEKKKRVI